ncbi:hypothetical protein Pint_28313 [Pistacia integerrima]|uniref:Uncharacterized protein n=1 Tax=Pistacia integerrima TaxID=434235 RepID=A0ACC0YUY5_9ROSI|nr:hypothetical protein Pint_28313 [Pistacia integerrima]
MVAITIPCFTARFCTSTFHSPLIHASPPPICRPRPTTSQAMAVVARFCTSTFHSPLIHASPPPIRRPPPPTSQAMAVVDKIVVQCMFAIRKKFIARKDWLVCDSDDKFILVYNYNTMEKVKEFEPHGDSLGRRVGSVPRSLKGIRIMLHNVTAVCIHPDFPILITVSKDKTVCVWDATNYRIAFGSDKGDIMVKDY